MKKFGIIAVVILAAAVFTGCASSSGVARVDSATQIDLSGYWNDTDVRVIADTLVNECVNAAAITNFIRENRKVPTVIVGSFRNLSDEHLDTSILVKKFEAALVNSGKVDFVADKNERKEIRMEREDQQANASEDSAKRLGNEAAADFMLVGSVKTIVDQAAGKSVRSYIVNAELIDVESNRKLWIGENSDIKKFIQRASARW
jgi:uncharacterized protein (TIGR02722 family)